MTPHALHFLIFMAVAAIMLLSALAAGIVINHRILSRHHAPIAVRQTTRRNR
jgi:hypothetical protein